MYYTTKFIDGLRDDIKSAVMLQRPSTWDTACVLARLREEVGDSVWKKEPRCSDSYSYNKHQFRTTMPLPTPPGKLEKPLQFELMTDVTLNLLELASLMTSGQLSRHIVDLKDCVNTVPKSGPGIINALLLFSSTFCRNCWRLLT